MTINVNDLVAKMLETSKDNLAQSWPDIRDYAETEFKGLAEGIALIEKLRASDSISDEQAKLLLDMKKNTAKIVLLSLEGLGILAVENAVNKALSAVKDSVNEALNFSLL